MRQQKIENTEMSVEVRISRRVKAIRILRGLTQKQLAEKCGYSNATICNIESGHGDYKISTLHQIENALQCTLILIPNEDLI